MVRTIISILVSFALLLGISAYEIYSVGTTFKTFSEALVSLYNKAEDQTATYEDGVAVRTYWKDKKDAARLDSPHQHRERGLSAQRSARLSLRKKVRRRFAENRSPYRNVGKNPQVLFFQF